MSQFDFTSLQTEIQRQKVLHNKLLSAFAEYQKELAKTSMDSQVKKEMTAASNAINGIISSVTQKLYDQHRAGYMEQYNQALLKSSIPQGRVKA